MSVGALITWPYKAGGRSRRGSPKAGTTVYQLPCLATVFHLFGLSFDCTCSGLVPNMRVSSMCSLVAVYLHSRAKMRTVFIYTSKISPLSQCIDLNLNLAILKLILGPHIFRTGPNTLEYVRLSGR